MDVEGSGDAAAFALFEGGTRQAIREEAEVRATARREPHPAPAERARWYLRDSADGSLEPVKVGAPAWVAVPLSANGEEARVVAMPFFDEDVERPLPTGDDRKARRAIAEHQAAGQVLEQALRAPHGVPKLWWAELRDTRMVPAV